jgi:hypothetical protein
LAITELVGKQRTDETAIPEGTLNRTRPPTPYSVGRLSMNDRLASKVFGHQGELMLLKNAYSTYDDR